MPRYFALISKEKLKEKIQEAYRKHEDYNEEEDDNSYSDWHEYIHFPTLTPAIIKDLKIDCDGENMDASPDSQYELYKGITGFQKLDNGFEFLGICSGGDWEIAVYFIIYWDGKNLRAYLPSKGNYYNHRADKKYGNEGEYCRDGFGYFLDIWDINKEFPDVADDFYNRTGNQKITKDYNEDSLDNYPEYSIDDFNFIPKQQDIICDIKNRIIPRK